MNDILFYPAVFHTAEEGGFWVSFPDIPECLTEGDNMSEAYKMAAEALGLCLSDKLKDKEILPAPSAPQNIELSDSQYLVLVQFNRMEYEKKHNSKAVKKTLTIPQWLNEAATEKNINFSQVLQDALKEELNII